MQRRDFLLTAGAAAAWTSLSACPALAQNQRPKVLYFTRGAFEHDPIKRHGNQLALSEKILTQWGAEAGFDVECSKDGRVFDGDLGKYDLFAFYTCNNLHEPDGHGNPPMSPSGLKRFLDAIAGGKGFVGFHSAADTFHSGRGDEVQKQPHPYVAMMGGEFISHGHQQDSLLPVTSPNFPGVSGMGKGMKFLDEWYSLKNFPSDLHVILMQETKGMTDWCYERPPYPATWARMHGKGRVFYTSFGHRDDIWTNPLVKQLVLGGMAWGLGRVDADITPNIARVAPEADRLPKFPPPPKVRVLVVTGVDYPGHPWKQTGPAVRDLLERDPRLEARIVEDPEFLASPALDDYDVVVMHFKNYQPLRRAAEVRKRLAGFVRRGKGLVLLHFACGAFEDWPEFADLAGKVYDRKTFHDPRGPFTVKIVNSQHPITRGMKDFQADDELYVCLIGQRPVDLLAVARSKVTGKDHPMAFAFGYGQGRVFHTPLGHDVKAFQMPGVAELIRRGCLWTAGR